MNAILLAAEQVFMRAGFAGARIDTIAAESGYNKSLIFQYFGDKEGLYKAVIHRIKKEIELDLEKFCNYALEWFAQECSREHVTKVIREAIIFSFSFSDRYPNIFRLLLWEAAEGWTVYKERSATDTSPKLLEQFIEYLERSQAEGYIASHINITILIAYILSVPISFRFNAARLQMLLPDFPWNTNDANDLAREQFITIILQSIIPPDPSDTEHTLGSDF